MSNDIWFAHKPGLVIVGRPVHWKGWALGVLFVAALLAIIFMVGETGATLDAAERRSLQIGATVIGLVLTLAFVIAAWPHRAPPPK